MQRLAQPEKEQMSTIASSPFQRLIQRWRIFWTLMLYGMLFFCIAVTLSTVTLTGLQKLQLFLLCGAFLLAYHGLLMHRPLIWPQPLRRTLLYFCVQVALISMLMHVHVEFGLLGYFLIFQVAGSLERKYWPVPMFAASCFIAFLLDIDRMIWAGEWLHVLATGLYLLIWPAVALFISILIHQRYRMQYLISDLQQAQTALEQYAQQADELATLRERSRLARDMHDSLGHALALINIKLEAAQRLYALDAKRGATELEATRDLVRQSMRELRQSLANLRSPPALEVGLIPAIHTLAETSAHRAGFSVQYDIAESIATSNLAQAEAIWRITREALSNIEKHAQAKNVQISLHRNDDEIYLAICDDGHGIRAADLSRPGHFGILGMREIAAQVGGILDIDMASGKGTCVRCHMRIPAE